MAASTSTATLHNWKHESVKKAKDEILAAVGDISGIVLRGQQVLVGVYLRPAATPGGLVVPKQGNNEDTWQGKIGLVLAHGPNAFPKGDVKVGDWVVHQAQQSWACSIRGPGGKISKERIAGDSALSGWREDDGWQCRWIYGDDVYATVSDLATIV